MHPTHPYRYARTSVIAVLLTLLSSTSIAADLHDSFYDSPAVHLYAMPDFDHAVILETASAVTLPAAPLGELAAPSTRSANTALPADRVARWRGFLR